MESNITDEKIFPKELNVYSFGTIVSAKVDKFLRSHKEHGVSEEDLRIFTESVIESAVNCGLDVDKSSQVRMYVRRCRGLTARENPDGEEDR